METFHIETELKYIVNKIPSSNDVIHITQSYFNQEPFINILLSLFDINDINDINTFRIREIIKDNKKTYFLTLKSKGNISRREYEKEIDKELYDLFFKASHSTIIKNRYRIPFDKYLFEVDEYLNLKEKLISLEIELENDNIIEETKVIEDILKNHFNLEFTNVSNEPKYKNSNLLKYFG